MSKIINYCQNLNYEVLFTRFNCLKIKLFDQIFFKKYNAQMKCNELKDEPNFFNTLLYTNFENEGFDEVNFNKKVKNY